MKSDLSKRFVVWEDGNKIEPFAKESELLSVLAFSNRVISEMIRLDLKGDVRILPIDPARSPNPNFTSTIVAIVGKSEMMAMGVNISIEDWDKHGPGYRVLKAETVEVMKRAFAAVDEGRLAESIEILRQNGDQLSQKEKGTVH